MSDAIIITTVVCLSIVFIVCVICYTNYKKENASEFEFIHKCIDSIYDKMISHYGDIMEIKGVIKNISTNIVTIKDDIEELNDIITDGKHI